MIRAVAVVSLVVLLVLVLYVPSAHPPSRFLEQMHTEHDAAIAFWGPEAAYRMLDRAFELQSTAAGASPLPDPRDRPQARGVDVAISREMASVTERLFNNRYFRSVDALLMLACYRLATLLEWLPGLLPLVLAAGVDGALARIVKAKEFLQHDPELFALWGSLLIVTACATVIAFVLPVTLHPAVLAGAPIAMAVMIGRAIASFHRRA